MQYVKPEFSGDETHLQVLLQAINKKDAMMWNNWRKEANINRPDLKGADLSGIQLDEINLHAADLTGACLKGANIQGSFDYAKLNQANMEGASILHSRLEETQIIGAICRNCNFRGSQIVASNFSNSQLQDANFERCYLEDTFFDWADLTGASFYQADLWMAFLRNATIHSTNFRGANLHGAKLTGSSITSCDLRRTIFVDSDIQGARISDCNIYGASAWNLKRDEKTFQNNLRVSNESDAPLYVDDLEVAQFIYLMVRNPRIRDVIDTISKKGVLILGRFTAERKAVLDAIREKLRELGYVPMIFDFEKPSQRDLEETVKVLAGLSRFIIADITNPSSSPLEVHAIIPDYMVPLIPIIQSGEKPFAMFEGLQQKYFWVLDTVEYSSETALIKNFEAEVIDYALDMENEIKNARSVRRPTRRIIE